MKKSLSRRDFLKYCGIGTAGVTAALALAGCSKKETTDDKKDENLTEEQQSVTKDLETGESQTTQKEVDTARPTTATDPDKRYP